MPDSSLAGYSLVDIPVMVQELAYLREEVVRLRRELTDARALLRADEAANFGKSLLYYVLDVLCAVLRPERGQTIVIGDGYQRNLTEANEAASSVGPLQAALERPAFERAMQGKTASLSTRYDSSLWLPLVHGSGVAVIFCLRRATTSPFSLLDKEIGGALSPLVINALQTGHQTFDLSNDPEELRTLSDTFSARVRQAGGRIAAMGRDSERLAKHFGLDARQCMMIGFGGILHDIGTVDLAEDIWSKEGNLSTRELSQMREHAVFGAEIVRQVTELEDVVPLVRHHHERWDGTGYPAGLAAGEIPFGSRIVAVVDAFHAMTSVRPHRPARSVNDALRELHSCAGSQFDLRVVEAYSQLLREGL